MSIQLPQELALNDDIIPSTSTSTPFEIPPDIANYTAETRTKRHSFSATLDRIDEDISLNQFTNITNDSFKYRKQSLDSMLHNKCSYYNKYFDCYQIQQQQQQQQEDEEFNQLDDACCARRYSTPDSTILNPSENVEENLHFKKYKRENLMFNALFSVSKEAFCAENSNPKNMNNQCNFNEKPKKSVALCFTPSQERIYENVKICFHCGHQKLNL